MNVYLLALVTIMRIIAQGDVYWYALLILISLLIITNVYHFVRRVGIRTIPPESAPGSVTRQLDTLRTSQPGNASLYARITPTLSKGCAYSTV